MFHDSSAEPQRGRASKVSHSSPGGAAVNSQGREPLGIPEFAFSPGVGGSYFRPFRGLVHLVTIPGAHAPGY